MPETEERRATSSVFASACRAYMAGETDASIAYERDDGHRDTEPVSRYFAEGPSALEAAVLAQARGRIVDVGCGAGRTVLSLQAAGADVAGMDLDPDLVALCRERGCRKVSLGDALEGALGAAA